MIEQLEPLEQFERRSICAHLCTRFDKNFIRDLCRLRYATFIYHKTFPPFASSKHRRCVAARI